MTLVLTTATNPGTAQWTNASLLGGAKFAKFVFVAGPGVDVIPGTVTGGAAFINKLTVPSGTVALGDLLSLGFVVQVNSPAGPPITSNYTIGIRVNGVVANIFSGSINSGQSYPINFGISGGTLGGVAVAGATGTIAVLGLLENNSLFSSQFAIVNPVNLTGAVVIEVWFNWTVGADPTAAAELGFIQASLVGETP